MNIRRGVFRTWAATSLLWVIYWVWQRNILCTMGIDITESQPWCADPIVEYGDLWRETFALIVGGPVLAGAAIASTLWIVQGFKTSD
jgi:hypothetical protein